MDEFIDCENSLINCCRAQRAWWEYNDELGDLDHAWHVRKGFLDGYKETAENGASRSHGDCQNEQCLPLMPPRCYWKHCYQNCEGRKKIDAWYQGYAHGSMAASQDGVYEFSVIPTYGLHNGMHDLNAQHTTSLEEDLNDHEHDQLVPEPDQALPGSDELVPVPETYDGLPKIPPEEESSLPLPPISGASYEFFERDNEPNWAREPVAIPAGNTVTRPIQTDLEIPKARFTEVSTTESASEQSRATSTGDFLLPVGYEGFRAPEWSEGENRE